MSFFFFGGSIKRTSKLSMLGLKTIAMCHTMLVTVSIDYELIFLRILVLVPSYELHSLLELTKYFVGIDRVQPLFVN